MNDWHRDVPKSLFRDLQIPSNHWSWDFKSNQITGTSCHSDFKSIQFKVVNYQIKSQIFDKYLANQFRKGLRMLTGLSSSDLGAGSSVIHQTNCYFRCAAFQRCNDSAFSDSRLNSDSDKVFGFNSNSILQDAHCIKTQFTIQFNHQLSSQFSSQFNSALQTSFQINSQFNSFEQWTLVFGYTILPIQLEIEPQPQCCQVWLVPTDRMQMCSKGRKYIIKIEL